MTTETSFFLLINSDEEDGRNGSPDEATVGKIFRKFIHETGRCGIVVQSARQNSGTPSQLEITLKSDCMIRMADQVMICRHLARNIAVEFNAIAHLSPAPVHDQYSSVFNVAFSLWNDRQPMFSGTGYAGTSESAMFAVGGILKHLPALTAFGNSTDESLHRVALNPDTQLASGYSQSDRSVVCRIPGWDSSPNSRQIELRFPDARANSYLLFAAILMAAIDGIQNKVDPGEPSDSWPPDDTNDDTHDRFPPFPRSIDEAFDALRQDQQFLLRGDVFNSDLIDRWTSLKQTN